MSSFLFLFLFSLSRPVMSSECSLETFRTIVLLSRTLQWCWVGMGPQWQPPITWTSQYTSYTIETRSELNLLVLMRVVQSSRRSLTSSLYPFPLWSILRFVFSRWYIWKHKRSRFCETENIVALGYRIEQRESRPLILPLSVHLCPLSLKYYFVNVMRDEKFSNTCPTIKVYPTTL